MSSHIVGAADRRRSETPAGVMITSASPTLGRSQGLSLWWVSMSAGGQGPAHVIDTEQLWSLVEGSADIDIDGQTTRLRPGDTAVLPAGVLRRIHAVTDLRAVVCGHGTARARIPGEETDRGTPPWIS